MSDSRFCIGVFLLAANFMCLMFMLAKASPIALLNALAMCSVMKALCEQ